MSLFPSFDSNDRPEQAARRAPRLRALAGRGVYFGTSSWKYGGWLGSIYSPARYQTRGKHSKARFERECLAEYAETFPTACGDFAFYQFPSAEYWAGLFDQLPARFLLGLKVPEKHYCKSEQKTVCKKIVQNHPGPGYSRIQGVDRRYPGTTRTGPATPRLAGRPPRFRRPHRPTFTGQS
jgi:hypothetical protein